MSDFAAWLRGKDIGPDEDLSEEYAEVVYGLMELCAKQHEGLMSHVGCSEPECEPGTHVDHPNRCAAHAALHAAKEFRSEYV